MFGIGGHGRGIAVSAPSEARLGFGPLARGTWSMDPPVPLVRWVALELVDRWRQ